MRRNFIHLNLQTSERRVRMQLLPKTFNQDNVDDGLIDENFMGYSLSTSLIKNKRPKNEKPISVYISKDLTNDPSFVR